MPFQLLVTIVYTKEQFMKRIPALILLVLLRYNHAYSRAVPKSENPRTKITPGSIRTPG